MTQIVYAHKEMEGEFAPFYYHIFPWLHSTKMCGSTKIYKLKVREVKDNEESQYWGWHDNETKLYQMIYPSKVQVKMCFVYGYKIEEERGKGRLVNLVLEEV